MEAKVSVVIPAYNRESYMEECILSVLQQSYQNFEILVVDDGSTDKTFEICKRLSENDKRIRLFSLPHTGVSAARNKAVDEAEGEYLFFVDSDDVIHPLLIEGLVRNMETHQVSIAAARGKDIPDQQWKDRIILELLKKKDFLKEDHLSNDQLADLFFCRDSVLRRMGGIMLRKSYVGDTRFRTNLQIGEDVCFMYENIVKGSAAVILKEKGYYWRWHDNKTSLNVSFSGFLSRLQCKEFLWRGEEKLGRKQYIYREKQSALNVYFAVLKMNPVYSEDSKKTRAAIKQYKKELLPIMGRKQKVFFFLSLYTPWLYHAVKKTVSFINKRKKSNNEK